LQLSDKEDWCLILFLNSAKINFKPQILHFWKILGAKICGRGNYLLHHAKTPLYSLQRCLLVCRGGGRMHCFSNKEPLQIKAKPSELKCLFFAFSATWVNSASPSRRVLLCLYFGLWRLRTNRRTDSRSDGQDA